MSLVESVVISKLNVVRIYIAAFLDDDQKKQLEDAFDTIKDLAKIAAAKRELEK